MLAGCGRLSFDGHADGGNKDGGSQQDGGGPPACNAITRLADDFTTDRRKQLWAASYTDDTSSIAIGGGTATLNLSANAANSYLGLVSGHYYDLREHRIFVGLQHPANANTSSGLGINTSQKTLAHIVVEDGAVIAVRELDGNYLQVASAPYDPAAARFLALSEHAGRLAWQTSADGVTFTTLYDEPDPFPMALVSASLFAGSALALAAPGTAVFDQLDGGVAAPIGACKAATLVDPFDATLDLWENSFRDACCADLTANGQVVLSSDGSAGFAGHRSSAGYDLRDSAVVVMTKGPQQMTKLAAEVTAIIDPQNYIALEMRQTDGYECNAYVNGTLSQTPAAISPSDEYVRLRESAGTFAFEASSDGTTWRELATIVDPIDLSDVVIGLEIGNSLNSAADSVAFEGINAP